MVVAWIVIAVALTAFELHHLAFYALFGALGALAAAIVAVPAPHAIGVQLAVAVLVAAVGTLTVRPYVSRIIHRRSDGRVALGVHGGFVGVHAVTVDIVGDALAAGDGSGPRPGHVRLAGEQWLAVSGIDEPISPGIEVVVTAVNGTTLTVCPLHPIPGVGALVLNNEEDVP
jgi:membrane protein implicated in regulation of membrane protease activity